MPVTVLVLALAGLGGLGYAAWKVSRMDTVFPSVTVAGVDLGGMTRDQAVQALFSLGAEKYDGLTVTASLPLGNSLTVTAREAGLTWSVDRAVDAAWRYGREDGMLGDLLLYAQAKYLGRNTFSWEEDPLDVTLDQAAIQSIVTEAAADIDAQLLESSYNVGEGELRLVKGASGLTLDEGVVTELFVNALLAGDGSGFTYESAPDTDETFDFQSLHDELYAEKVEAQLLYAKDYQPTAETAAQADGTSQTSGATSMPEGVDFEGEPYKVTRSVVGVDFDVAEAERLWAEAGYGDTVVVPLVITEPETTTEDIESLLFADNLSKNWTMVKIFNRDYSEEVRTTLAGSTDDRISNVKKACERINGMMLMPGDSFSFNDALGQRTEEDGWLPATAYADGQVLQSIGGGICQVSSTLYNAVLYSNLEILERTCHQFQVGYLPWGMDATVSWGWPDFKFRNNARYPIKIVAWVDEETNECCVQIKGTDVDHVYVIMRFNNWEIFDETNTYHDADGNPLAVGMAASTWRMVYHDGDDYATATPISDEYEAYSTYNYHKEDLEARNVPLPGAPEDTPVDPDET